ncbi:MAG: TIGR04255 family protein [Candidatus Margulisiibacteriota bacterium]|jgi:uncharacterized protein (TIGR04255 family)
MTFNIPKVERTSIINKFKRHLLDTVILRIDFADIFDAKELASKCVSVLAKEYPLREEENEELVRLAEFSIIPVKKMVSYIIKNPDTNNYIKINPTCLVFEYKKYQGFENLISVFNKIFSLYNNFFPDNNILRLGLRKISFFDQEESSKLETFKNYFNDFLTANLSQNYFGVSLIQNMHNYVIKGSENDKYDISFKSGTLKLTKNEISTRRFVLDIDGFATKDLEPNNLVERIIEINDKMFDIFYWSIGEKMKEWMQNDK